MKASAVIVLSFALIIALSPVLSSPGWSMWRPVHGDNLTNWAGYHVSDDEYTYISATWVIPTVSNTTSGYSSAWIGIGGFNAAHLIQVGSEHDSLPSTQAGPRLHGSPVDTESVARDEDGIFVPLSYKPVYYLWWEAYPLNAEQKIASIAVAPGDTISASIQQVAFGVWVINITDVTRNQSFQTTTYFSPDLSTAEAITERPSMCLGKCRLTDLADFGNVTFSQTFARGTASGYFEMLPNKPLTMVSSDLTTIAYPTTLVEQGVFSVIWRMGG